MSSFDQFNSSSQKSNNLSSIISTDIKQFKVNETIRIRECLAALNSKDLRNYFQGVRKLCNELEIKKQDFEVESIVHQQNLKQLKLSLTELKENLFQVKNRISTEKLILTNSNNKAMDRIKNEAPELFEKIEKLRELQQKQNYLKFQKYFVNLRDEIRHCLRKGNYSLLLENYRKLLKIPNENIEFLLVKECFRDYTVKSASLAQFLQLELHSTLFLIYSRIHFPFEEAVDFNHLKPQLFQTAQILKCLKLINIETASNKNTKNVLKLIEEDPIELVLNEFDKRFNYHFYGDKKTNLPNKPEWFFSQLSNWAENNLEYFEHFLQPFIDEMSNYYPKYLTAKQIFLERLMKLASEKVEEMLKNVKLIKDRLNISNLIDECVLFEREMEENFGYNLFVEESKIHVISIICNFEQVLDCWIRLERDTLSAGVDAILADNNAYEPRYKEAIDVDPYLVPNFADSFVILMQSMSERYRSIPDMKIQYRFLKLQLLIVDEFRSRIVQIGQFNRHNCFVKPFPQLLNALWYLTLLLDDWSDSPEFVRLQFFLQQLQSNHEDSTNQTTSSSSSTSLINSLARGTFDESASLYRHVWRLWVKNMCEAFSELISKKLTEKYSFEKWYCWEGSPKPTEITPSFEPFLRKIGELLEWITLNISPDSVLTFQHLTNHEVWSCIDLNVISQTAFNYRGAAQILYDTTNALIPLLNHCYGKMRGVGVFDVFNEKCVSVLSTLRLLSLPPPTAILLKDEIKNIPEQQLDQKLEQFNIIGMTKVKVIQLLEQRCDLVAIEKLIG